MTMIVEAFRTLGMLLDKVVYSALEWIYAVMLKIADHKIFEVDTLERFANRMYSLIGIAMMFVLAFNLINSIIDPSKFTSKEKGFSKLVQNILITLVLIVAVPMIFKVAYKFQGIVMDSNFIPEIIVGTNYQEQNTREEDEECEYYFSDISVNGSRKTSNYSLSGDEDTMEIFKGNENKIVLFKTGFLGLNRKMYGITAPEFLSEEIDDTFSSFQCKSQAQGIAIGCNLTHGNRYSNVLSEVNSLTSNSCPSKIFVNANLDSSLIKVSTEKRDYDVSVGYVLYDKKKAKNFASTIFFQLIKYNDKFSESEIPDNVKLAFESRDLNKIDNVINEKAPDDNGEDEFYISYPGPLTTIIGIAVALFVTTMCIDIALRSVKLAFLQIISPIPIISYVDPKGKTKMFDGWVKECVRTYLDLFLRILLISFLVLGINLVGDAKFGGFGIGIFMIFGLLLFAKQAPKMIESMTGFKMSGGMLAFNPFKKLADVPGLKNAAGLAGGGIQGLKSGGLGGAAFGAILGASKGGKEKGFYSAFDKGADVTAQELGGTKFSNTNLIGDVLTGGARGKAERAVLTKENDKLKESKILDKGRNKDSTSSGSKYTLLPESQRPDPGNLDNPDNYDYNGRLAYHYDNVKGKTKENELLEQTIQSKQRENAVLKTESDNLKANLNVEIQQYNQIKNDFEMKKKTINDNNLQIKNIEQQMNNIKGPDKTRDLNYINLDKERTNLNNLNTNLKAEIKSLHNKAISSSESINTMNKDLDFKNQTVLSNEKEISNMYSKQSSNNKKIKDSTKSFDKLKVSDKEMFDVKL